jgi:uncharacterized membrane protein
MNQFLVISILALLLASVNWKLFAILLSIYAVYKLVVFCSVKVHHPTHKD